MIRASTDPTKFIKHEGEAENAAGLRNFQKHMKLRHPGGKQSNTKGPYVVKYRSLTSRVSDIYDKEYLDYLRSLLSILPNYGI